MPTFNVDLSLSQFAASADERAALFMPLLKTLKIFFIFIVAAFVLHLRLIWCRIQYLLIGFLLICAILMTQKRALVVTRKTLSSYEQLFARNLEPNWHLVIVVYAVWIAYGAVFHEGRHMSEDLAVLDGLLLLTDIGSSTLVMSVRFVTLIVLTFASLSPRFFMRIARSGQRDFLLFGLLSTYVLLLGLPSPTGVPQVLSVSSTLLRVLAFLAVFLLSEMWRCVVEHFLFIWRLFSNSADPLHLYLLQEKTVEKKAVVTAYTASSSLRRAPPDVLSIEEFPISFPLLSVLRSAWLLTVSTNTAAYVGAFVCCVSIIHQGVKWSRKTTMLVKHRLHAQRMAATFPAPESKKLNGHATVKEAPQRKRIIEVAAAPSIEEELFLSINNVNEDEVLAFLNDDDNNDLP